MRSHLRHNDVVKIAVDAPRSRSGVRPVPEHLGADLGADLIEDQRQEDHEATRTRVVRSLVVHGPATAPTLAGRLGLTAGGIRRHLDALSEAGLVDSSEQPPYGPRAPRRRGRPARVYSVTEEGRSLGSGADATLAREVLRHLRRTLGDDGVRRFAQERLTEQAQRFTRALADLPVEDRPRELARLLTADGYAASVDAVPGSTVGVQICQHDCPVAQVATEFPELCDAEARMFSEVLGTHVQRLATLAHGDGVCTTHLPATGPPQNPPPSGIEPDHTPLPRPTKSPTDRSTS